jgi:hypothetical protein
VDLACYALVAEGASGGLLEAWWLRSLGFVSMGLLRVKVKGLPFWWCGGRVVKRMLGWEVLVLKKVAWEHFR